MAMVAYTGTKTLTSINLHKNNMKVIDKLVLGADYLFVIDPFYSTPVGKTVPISIDDMPIDVRSELMAHSFSDTNGSVTWPCVRATILNGANLMSCTIIHARITTAQYDPDPRRANEIAYAKSRHVETISFPYVSEATALDMMRGKHFITPREVTSIITRSPIEDLLQRADSIESLLADSKPEDCPMTDVNESISNISVNDETFDNFMSKVSDNAEVYTNASNETNTTSSIENIKKMTNEFINNLSHMMSDTNLSESDKTDLEKWISTLDFDGIIPNKK